MKFIGTFAIHVFSLKEVEVKNLFSFLLGTVLCVIAVGCTDEDSPVAPEQVDDNIVLNGRQNEVEELVVPQFEKLVDMALNPGRELEFNVATESDSYTRVCVLYDTSGTGYPHPVIEVDGDRMHMVLERKLLLVPVVRYYDDRGNRIIINGEEYEHGLGVAAAKRAQDGFFDPLSWFSGDVIKFVVVALGAWIGFKLGALVLSVLAAIAYAALLVGIFIGAVNVLPDVLKWLADLFGVADWDISAIQSYAVDMGQKLTLILSDIIQ